jgi:TrpR family transcriptional regulator, trp operon repressor
MRGEDDIIGVFTEIRDRRTMRDLFAELFTPAERRDVALRWRLMRMLYAGVSQRDVAAQLGISLCKITRGSRVLKGSRSVARRILDAREGRAAGAPDAPKGSKRRS